MPPSDKNHSQGSCTPDSAAQHSGLASTGSKSGPACLVDWTETTLTLGDRRVDAAMKATREARSRAQKLKAESVELSRISQLEQTIQALDEHLADMLQAAPMFKKAFRAFATRLEDVSAQFTALDKLFTIERFLLGETLPFHLSVEEVEDEELQMLIVQRDLEIACNKDSRLIGTGVYAGERLFEVLRDDSVSSHDLKSARRDFERGRKGRMLYDIFRQSLPQQFGTLVNMVDGASTDAYGTDERGNSFVSPVEIAKTFSAQATGRDPTGPYIAAASFILTRYKRIFEDGQENHLRRFVSRCIDDAQTVKGRSGEEVHDVWLASYQATSHATRIG